MKLGPLSTARLFPTREGTQEIQVDNLINDARVLATCVIGCYESQLHSWINDSIAYGYDKILDVGCAYGYYAVGFALKSRTSTVYACDTDQRARENTAELARLKV
jgi:methylase of polypeptide subunit release factors